MSKDMICVNCGSNSAQQYQRTADGKEIIVCLCPACYKKSYPESNAADLFTHFLGDTGGRRSKACPDCGTTLGDYRKTGLLGCEGCYNAFREELLSSIRYVQRGVAHRGKQPDEHAGAKYDLVRELSREQADVETQLEEARRRNDEIGIQALEARLYELKEKWVLTGRSS